MKGNFERCLPKVLSHEGGWSDHPSDPGGATMKGITIGTYAQWKGRKVTKDELRNITDAEVAAIYRRKYWDKVKGDDLPSGVDYVAFDAAVNSGPARSARWLQLAVGATQDGQIGPATVAAAQAQYAPAVVERAIGARLSFLRGLKTWPTFGKGWHRRVDDVRTFALAIAGDAKPITTNPVDASKQQDFVVKPDPATQPAAPIGGQTGFWAALARVLAAIFGKGKQQ